MQIIYTCIGMIDGNYTVMYFGYPAGTPNNPFYFILVNGNIEEVPSAMAIEAIAAVSKEYE